MMNRRQKLHMHQPWPVRNCLLALIASTFTLLSSLTMAQDTDTQNTPLSADQPSSWRFETLAAAALQQYPSIIAGQRQLEASQSDLEAAKWERFPTPDLQASSDNDVTQTVIGLQQPLWTGGRISAGIDAASSRSQASSEQLTVLRQEVFEQVVDAFAEAQRASAQLVIATRNVDELRDLQQRIQRRVNQKASPEADLELASSRLSEAISERTAIAQSERTSLARLSELAGQRIDDVGNAPDMAELQLADSLDAAQQEATEYSPRLGQLRFQQQAARADTRSERAAFFPTLSLRLEQQETHGSGVAASEESDSRALIVLESSFGAGLSTAAGVSAATSLEQSLIQERETALRELRSTVADLWYQRESAQLRLASAQRTRVSAERVSASYARQYAIGQKSWLDLMNAVREASRAGLSVEDARAEVFRTSLRLVSLTGNTGALLSNVQP